MFQTKSKIKIPLLSAALIILFSCTGSDLVEVYGGTPKVTKAQYDKLRTGMTIAEVRSIIGGDCDVLSEVGDPGSSFYTIMYGCDGKGQMGANMNFMMQGGKLYTKAQYGLK